MNGSIEAVNGSPKTRTRSGGPATAATASADREMRAIDRKALDLLHPEGAIGAGHGRQHGSRRGAGQVEQDLPGVDGDA